MDRQPSVQDFIEMALRRKWWIIIPFFLVLVVSYGVYKRLPKIYLATTTILVQPQEIPEDYIKATVTSSISDWLHTLSQQILSRTHLEKVIREFNLYPDLVANATMEEVVEVMRGSLRIQVQGTRGRRDVANTFTISYWGKKPRQVMQVTNRLASLFIEENLRAREKQAAGTFEFIERELSIIESDLKEKEKDIRAFKERHMGELPQQLDANLRILGNLQDQINNNNDARKAAEERRIMLQGEISRLTQQLSGLDSGELMSGNSAVVQLRQLKARLRELESMYTERHPDVVDAKAQIAKLEEEIASQIDFSEKPKSEQNPLVFNPTAARLRSQLVEVELEISRLEAEKETLRKQIAKYERRVEITPQIEEELTTLTRDYDLLKANYQSLLDKRIHAKMAENLERSQLGKQFRVLDPARIPEKPFKPDRNKIMLIGVFFGLVLGGGLGYMKETMDRSFRNAKDVEEFLELRVIAAIPRIETKNSDKKAA